LERRIAPDEAAILLELAREIDSASKMSAWHLIGDIRRCDTLQKPKELPAAHEGVAANLHRCTVGILKGRFPKLEVATGVLIQIADRNFVATVSHIIPTSPAGKISFLSEKLRNSDELRPEILSFRRVDQDRPDVGFLELDPRFVTEELKKEPITLDRIKICGPGQENSFTTVFGYPRDLAEHTRPSAGVACASFTSQSFGNVILHPRDWNQIDASSDPLFRPDPEMDIVLPYPIEDEMDC
jgi:hypothetical protein